MHSFWLARLVFWPTISRFPIVNAFRVVQSIGPYAIYVTNYYKQLSMFMLMAMLIHLDKNNDDYEAPVDWVHFWLAQIMHMAAKNNALNASFLSYFPLLQSCLISRYLLKISASNLLWFLVWTWPWTQATRAIELFGLSVGRSVVWSLIMIDHDFGKSFKKNRTKPNKTKTRRTRMHFSWCFLHVASQQANHRFICCNIGRSLWPGVIHLVAV